jgi:hypothetical protein
MLAGAVGSRDVVSALVGLLTGKGLLAWHAVARAALVDGLSVGTLGYGTLGLAALVNLDCSTLGVGVSSGVIVPGRSMGRRMSQSCCMAWVHEMESLAEKGTVLPKAVRMSIASRRERSACVSDGAVQWVGYRRHVLATRYSLVPGM